MVTESAMGALTPRQREAIDHRGGNLLVEAVPGSGKTRVIVARALALLSEGIYRHAKSETTSLAYVYLGAESKRDKFKDAAHDDRLNVGADAPELDFVALRAIVAVLGETFFEPWTTDGMAYLEPTRNARTCGFCEFVTVCPGFQEDDD